MIRGQIEDQMVLISQLYPGVYTQVPEQGETKARRRRKKSKGESSGTVAQKRKLSTEQVNMLELNFGNEHKLESERKDRLASELGLDPRQVAIPSEEDATIKDVAAQFNRLQLKNFNEHMHCYRGTHLKTQGCVAGKIIVHDKLPEHLRQGMFKTPGTYDCIMRYSSLLPKLAGDNVALPRGIGIKIFGIKGEKIWGEDKETQDWTFNNYPILELRTPKATNEIAESLERNFDDIPKFAEEMGQREDAEVATVPVKLPRQHMYAMPEYSQSAYRHGDYVAKYGVFPLGEEQIKQENVDVKEDDPINILATECRNFHLHNKVTYAFCAQMLQNIEEQPVDDIGIEWDPVKYPFEQIATLEFQPQDSYLPEFRTWWDDRITVNSWHGLKEHQPLGSTNRMRRVVYAESRKLRMQVNGYKDYIEPSSLNEVPVPIAAPLLALKV